MQGQNLLQTQEHLSQGQNPLRAKTPLQGREHLLQVQNPSRAKTPLQGRENPLRGRTPVQAQDSQEYYNQDFQTPIDQDAAEFSEQQFKLPRKQLNNNQKRNVNESKDSMQAKSPPQPQRKYQNRKYLTVAQQKD